MTAITFTASDVAPVEIISQFDGPAAESISAGAWVRPNTTTGKIELGNATSAAEIGNRHGIALSTVVPNQAVTAMEKGVLDVGDALGDLDFDAAVYVGDQDHYYADSAGTTEQIAGTVTPGWGRTGSVADKLLAVDL